MFWRIALISISIIAGLLVTLGLMTPDTAHAAGKWDGE